MTVPFKVGDSIIITHASRTGGWWSPAKDDLIGQTHVIQRYDEFDNTFEVEAHLGWWFPRDCAEFAEKKFIDGVEITMEEFRRRTAEPVTLTVAEIQEKLGIFVKIKD